MGGHSLNPCARTRPPTYFRDRPPARPHARADWGSAEGTVAGVHILLFVAMCGF